jgi:hypothetical protein
MVDKTLDLAKKILPVTNALAYCQRKKVLQEFLKLKYT